MIQERLYEMEAEAATRSEMHREALEEERRRTEEVARLLESSRTDTASERDGQVSSFLNFF